MKHLHKLFLISFLLTGCTQSDSLNAASTSLPVSPPSFQPTPTQESLIQSSIVFQQDDFGKQIDEKVWINFPTIYAIDSTHLFLYGTITSGDSLRSLLLKSKDGGLTWQEVARPIYGSSVLSVSLLTSGEGWMMTGWTLEVVDNLTLFHSTDFGDTWIEISKVPLRQIVPARMQFLSHIYGEIEVIYEGGAPGEDRIAKFITTDGGKTWEEAYRIPLAENAINIYDNYNNTLPNPQITTGKDGSVWFLDQSSYFSSSAILYRVLDDGAGWQIVSVIPTEYRYVNGNILSSK